MLDHPAYRVVAWLCTAGLGVALVVLVVRSQWPEAATIALFLVVTAAFLALRRRLPALFGCLFAVAALANGLGWAFDVWDVIPLYDPATHAFTTFAGALALGYLTHQSTGLDLGDHRFAYAVTVAAFGLAFGALWEIFEWLIQVEQTYETVVVDLTADALGALAAAALSATEFAQSPRDSGGGRDGG